MSDKHLSSTNVGFLIGKTLEQLALGQYEFQLNFSDNASLSVQQKLVAVTNIGSFEVNANSPAETKELYFLLGRKIDSAEMDSTKALKLVFDDLSTLTIPGTQSGYDSYLIWNNGEYIAA